MGTGERVTGWSALVELLAPEACGGCAAAGTSWCPACAGTVGPPHRLAPTAALVAPVFAAGRYRGPLRTALLAYKERGRRDLAGPLAVLLAAPLAAARSTLRAAGSAGSAASVGSVVLAGPGVPGRAEAAAWPWAGRVPDGEGAILARPPTVRDRDGAVPARPPAVPHPAGPQRDRRTVPDRDGAVPARPPTVRDRDGAVPAGPPRDRRTVRDRTGSGPNQPLAVPGPAAPPSDRHTPAPPPTDATLWLVPAPSRPSAARARGGDHVLRLCRLLAARDPSLRVAPALRLARRTRDSVGLDARQRRANLAGRLRVRTARLPPPGATAVIVDDVVTSGATLAACTAALTSRHVRVAAAVILCDATTGPMGTPYEVDPHSRWQGNTPQRRPVIGT